MQIAIIGDSFGFPNGTGATARVHAYAKGLAANGVAVRVLCLKTSERCSTGALNLEPKGVLAGVPFEYACGTTVRARSFLGRRCLEARSAWRLMCCLLQRSAECPRFDAAILFSNSLCWMLLTIALCRIAGTSCILEKSEFPFVYEARTVRTRMLLWLLRAFVYRLFAATIVISSYLEAYFRDKLRLDLPILRIPILVDPSEFDSTSGPKSQARRSIVYAGNLGHIDEVEALIAAFGQCASKHPDVDLVVLGDQPGTPAMARLRGLALEIGLHDRVHFKGLVSRPQLAVYLCSASVLALPRAAGLFSQAGFPTKLGEYLATGQPVLVTATGDIADYLVDGVNAYLVRPGDHEALARRLDYVLAHPQDSESVGLRGRAVAQRHFDCRVNCLRIIELVGSLRGQGNPKDQSACSRGLV